MALQFKFFTIPIKDSDAAEEEMNRFLASVKVITVHRDFVVDGGNSCRLIDIEYQTGDAAVQLVKSGQSAKKKIDYKEVLSPDDFAVYARLRDWRKETGERDGAQLYNIFNNEQMAYIVQNKICTKSGLKNISGDGEARVEKYGDAVVAIMTEEIGKLDSRTKGNKSHETGVEPVLFDQHPGKPERSISKSRPGQTR